MDSGGRSAAPSLGYEFGREEEARDSAAELDRRFTGNELKGLWIYRVRWSGNYLVEAVFSEEIPDSRLGDARALLGELGAPVHPDDLEDYKRATGEGSGGLPDWLRRLFGS
ncbi:MAG TPA: hypothetical protein VK869_11095 [Rubrobacteraceae bacterium]|nr:hypothetical protein [Rubrobacteraceae bacterium]